METEYGKLKGAGYIVRGAHSRSKTEDVINAEGQPDLYTHQIS